MILYWITGLPMLGDVPSFDISIDGEIYQEYVKPLAGVG